jgi:hypothetical protein
MSLKVRICLVVLGWFLVGTTCVAPQILAAAEANADTETPPAAPESSSPSQEVRARIEQIRRNEFFYQSYGKQDPFKPLISGDYQPVAGAELVDLNSAKLVGVIWGAEDRFALVEDGEGYGYILRVGDRVRNGRISVIAPNLIKGRITLYGISNTVVLKLEKTEG